MDINNFEEIRKDGKRIPEFSSIEYISTLGAPEIIIESKWEFQGNIVNISSNLGMLCRVLPDRSGVISKQYLDESKSSAELIIYNPDGSVRVKLVDVIKIHGKSEKVNFLWFEKSTLTERKYIGVVVERLLDGKIFQIDIYSGDGHIANVSAVR